MVDRTEYGEVRQFGNFSFLRIYEVGVGTNPFVMQKSRLNVKYTVNRDMKPLITNQKRVLRCSGESF
jgi:hypothetical protein